MRSTEDRGRTTSSDIGIPSSQSGPISHQPTQNEVSLSASNTRSATDRSTRDSQGTPTLATVPTAQAITVLASQIPTFDGSEEEDIESWIHRVDLIANTHGVSDGVTLLAASSKLLKHAKDWYYMEEGPSNHSWFSLKEAILKRFKRHIPFYLVMQKVEARKWNFGKESFQEYAMHKLKLLHSLKLPEREKVQLIINGINSISLRATATALHAATIDEFLDRMYEITSSLGSFTKKTSPLAKKKEKTKNSPPSPSKKDQSKSDKDEICSYCKAKGHRKINCFKLKKKEGTQPASSTTSSVAAAEEDTPATSEKSTVAAGTENSSRAITMDNSVPKVKAIDGINCQLPALLDTGSPVSFVRKHIIGYDLRNHADHDFVETLTKLAVADGVFDSDRDIRRQLVIEATQKVKDYNKIYYDKRHKTLSKYKVSDFVGPYIIDKVLSSNRYVIKDIHGHNLSPGPYNSILSPDRIKA
ncbi:hypothetical protein ALC60_00522 [Trachymyrmex zeteki]|nr:hypothetical protein ALC60_00522 [Trachymyrmex zeteki]